ncbi:unnamed protein product [Mytilus coruscus]|uniref:Retropepsins domain-containing protein n=1 Tax=Mytilus coruscus TaxID=42192 RepID=A0A6J8B0D4_MYTCO|nr:unnamed protein product [Mytilus coruscus]
MSTVTRLVQEKSAKPGTSLSSRSPNRDNGSSNYSPRRKYRDRGRRRRKNNRQQPKQLTPRYNPTKDERRVEFEETNFVQDETEETSTNGASVCTLGSAHLFWNTVMRGAGRDMRMTCRITNPTEFSIQQLAFKETLHVAHTDCDMLIGVDFLIKNYVILDVPAKRMSLMNTQVTLKLGSEPSAPHVPIVNRVTVQ